MVVSAQPAGSRTVVMGDRVVLTIPAETRFRSVATLVVGGIVISMYMPIFKLIEKLS